MRFNLVRLAVLNYNFSFWESNNVFDIDHVRCTITQRYLSLVSLHKGPFADCKWFCNIKLYYEH